MFKVLPILLTMLFLISCGGGSSGGGETDTNNSQSKSSSESSSLAPIEVPTEAPTANAGEDQTVRGGFTTKLSAANSLAPAGKTLTYEWTQTTEHDAMFVTAEGTLTTATDTQDIFVYIPATEAGKELIFSLTVSDGNHTSEADTVTLTVADCFDGEGDVFIECIDPSWSGIASYQEIDYDGGDNYYSNGINNHVTWSIIDLKDDEHNNVIDVKFHREDSTGNFSITSPMQEGADMPALDMTDFAGGYIKFDVRAIGTPDPLTLYLDIQCGYPCGVDTLQIIETLPDSEWRNVTIPIADLIGIGLETSKISTALIINPLWGDQANVNFQLDNIRWEK